MTLIERSEITSDMKYECITPNFLSADNKKNYRCKSIVYSYLINNNNNNNSSSSSSSSSSSGSCSGSSGRGISSSSK